MKTLFACARPIVALSFLAAWNLASVHQAAVVVAQSAGNRTIAGELIVEPPTLINLGFEWFIQGDDNRNASVAVAYRKQGAAQWNDGASAAASAAASEFRRTNGWT